MQKKKKTWCANAEDEINQMWKEEEACKLRQQERFELHAYPGAHFISLH